VWVSGIIDVPLWIFLGIGVSVGESIYFMGDWYDSLSCDRGDSGMGE